MHGTLATVPDPTGFAHYGLTAYEVGNDSMQPTIWARDVVLAAPVTAYAGEGIYVFRLMRPDPRWAREAICFRVWRDRYNGRRRLALSRDNEMYWRDGKPDPDYVDEAWFRANVLGKVAMHCRVLEHALMQGVRL